jgi:hypothetical protein
VAGYHPPPLAAGAWFVPQPTFSREFRKRLFCLAVIFGKNRGHEDTSLTPLVHHRMASSQFAVGDL